MLKTNKKIVAATFITLGTLAAIPQDGASETLPFDPARISRLSVDEIPRSISVRQGNDVWFGYDLEQALVFKVWRAPKDQPGLIRKDFKTQSAGTVLFEAIPDEGWRIEHDGKRTLLAVRYLGCKENKESFELRWELSHPAGTFQLSERIPTKAEVASSKVVRELRIESPDNAVSLILPSAYREAWTLTGPEGAPAESVTGSKWHRLSLR